MPWIHPKLPSPLSWKLSSSSPSSIYYYYRITQHSFFFIFFTMLRFRLLQLFLVSAFLLQVYGQGCSSDIKCPNSAPCCSEFGYCGTSSLHCLGGCNPDASFQTSSCKPMPRCTNQMISFTNNAKPYVPISQFNGDSSQSALTLDQGVAQPGKNGLKLLLTKDGQASQGTRLSTTRYMYYGKATAVMRHESWNGVVHAFISMSNTKDEIDWEFTKQSGKDAETNYYWFGKPEGWNHGYTVPPSQLPPNFDLNDWHSYTIDWSYTSLQWLIDGTVVRTLERDSTKDDKGVYHYPSSPSRLQISIWGAGTKAYPPGTVEWSGGYIDWSKAKNGAFTTSIKSLEIVCNDPIDLPTASQKPNLLYSSDLYNPENSERKVLATSKSSRL